MDEEAVEVVAVDDRQEKATSPGRSWKKPLLIGVGAVIAIALIVWGIMAAVVASQARALEREKAEAAYAAQAQEYDEAAQELRETLARAERLESTTSEEDVTEEGLLIVLSNQIALVKDEVANLRDPSSQHLEDLSNEEIHDEGKAVRAAEVGVTMIRDGLQETIFNLEAAVAEKKAADEEARQKAQKAKAKKKAKNISYEDLFRAGDTLMGDYFEFKGKIIQSVGEEDGSRIYRVNITADQGYSRVFWEDTVLLVVDGQTDKRLLEDDIIEFVAASGGVTEYEAVSGATIEVPLLFGEGEDVKLTGRDS